MSEHAAYGNDIPVARPPSAPDMADLRLRLEQTGADLAIIEGDDTAPFTADFTGTPGPRPGLVLRPKDTADAVAALGLCHRLGQRVVVQGGLTGLAGGARPQPGEIALSTTRMTRLEEVDTATDTVIAGAGVPLQAVQDAAAQAGLFFGVDIGARGTATIGGMAATNAGGIRVLGYGMMREQIVGLEAVLPDGRVISRLNGLAKDNTGPDLSRAFIGSEGILGLVTRVRLRLRPAAPLTAVGLLHMRDLAAAQSLLAGLRRTLGPRLTAFEAIWPEVWAGMAGMRSLPFAPADGIFVLTEIHGWTGPDRDAFETALMAAIEDGRAHDAVVSTTEAEARRLWQLREAVNAFTATQRPLTGFDISLPPQHTGPVVDDLRQRVARIDPEARVFIFGHLGDGNLHFVVGSPLVAAMADPIFGAVAAAGGAITAEHGVGADKRGWLPLVRGGDEIAALRDLKRAFDPAGILNMDRVLP